MTDYLVIYEGDDAGGWGAYSPDLPGCIATGATRASVELRMAEAVTAHVSALKAEELPVPKPSSYSGYVAA